MKKLACMILFLSAVGLSGCVKTPSEDNTKVTRLPLEETSITPDYAELYRPQYHYTALDSWINDPNGLVYFDGVYHMYYQSNPHINYWGNMTWGHAVSTDLIHWEEKDFCLFPDRVGTMFSGGGYADVDNKSGFFENEKGGIIVAYSTDTQHVGIAYSSDGYNFTKLSDKKPIIKNPGVRDFRDPFIFYHEETEKWIIVLAGGQLKIYTSSDLYNWELASENDIYTECPSLFPLECNGKTRWVLCCSSRGYYVGEFDGVNFTPETPYLDMTIASDAYASIPFTGTGKRVVMIHWLNNWAFSGAEGKWNGSMSIPVELELVKTGDSYSLKQKTVSETSLLNDKVLYKAENKNGGEIDLSGVNSNSFMFECVIDSARLGDFKYTFFKGLDMETVLSYDAFTQTMTFDRGIASMKAQMNSGNERYSFKVYNNTLADGKTRIKVLADVSSVEIFVNDGIYYGGYHVRPFTTCTAMELDAEGIIFDYLKVTSLKSIHFDKKTQADAVHIFNEMNGYIKVGETVTVPVASFANGELKATSTDNVEAKIQGNDLVLKGISAGSSVVRLSAGNHYKDIELECYNEGEGTFESNLGELEASGGIYLITPFDVSLESGGDSFAISNVEKGAFVLEAELSLSREGAGALIFAYKNQNNFYCLNIDANEKVCKLWKKTDGKVTDISTKNVALETNKKYSLKVEVNDTSIKGYLDENRVISVSEYELTSGRLGINAFNCKATFAKILYNEID